MKNFLAILLLVFSGSLYGEQDYRVPSLLDDGERATYIPEGSYKILGVSIGSATLEEINSLLGGANIYKGYHTENHTCYVSDSYRVEFTISSLGFGYEVTTVDSPSSVCATTTRPVVNGIGLEIGMSRADVISVLGEPSQMHDNSMSYTYWIQERLSDKTQGALETDDVSNSENLWLDVYSNISVSFQNEIVSQFSVHTSKTY